MEGMSNENEAPPAAEVVEGKTKPEKAAAAPPKKPAEKPAGKPTEKPPENDTKPGPTGFTGGMLRALGWREGAD